ncbi:MAG TPA: hypothetical protein VHL31_10150 [Geminicoccus sp.]|jgi:hypothetical protein|uniref:hypothetical protein n=1 Tax=Geminicoccus sp. TaxID=2024832 RepID=UPI002E340F4C|nr:hypothetical protein [Geminicoccus sp.]HEX2526642.1 hypothetical protein [Geminicoccus sp.]
MTDRTAVSSCLFAGSVLAILLVASTAHGQGMSVGGGGYDGNDPFSSDPFGAVTGEFGVDDPAGDGADFTGRDALAVLRAGSLLTGDLPDGMQLVAVDEAGPAAFDQAQGAVGDVRLRLDGVDHDAAVVWRGFDDPGSSVAAIGQLAQSVSQRFRGTRVEETHVTVGEDSITCVVVRLADDHINVTCGMSIGLDPLQSLGMVDAHLTKGRKVDEAIHRAARLAVWGRDRWIGIESERHSG